MPVFEVATGAMKARLAFAIVCALLLGVWLWRDMGRQADSAPSRERLVAGLRAVVLALCGFWTLAWFAIAAVRFRYPFELEWASGAMRDACAHVVNGQPLYPPPGGGWFPYEYPPFYFWVSAVVMRVFGDVSYSAMRLVSIVSTLGSAVLIVLWVRDLLRVDKVEESTQPDRRPLLWGLIAAGLFLAAYRLTGAWYDIERLDMLFLLLSLAGTYALERAITQNRILALITSAVLFMLAFLTKQQAVLFIVGGLAALLWLRRGRQALVFGALSVALCGGAVVALNAATGGWFGYYCFKVPLANGIQPYLVGQFLLGDMPLFAPVIASVIVLGVSVIRSKESRNRYVLLACITAMGLAGSLLSRAHWGGDQNVLITGYVFLGIAACVLAGQAERHYPAAGLSIYALLLAQLLVMVYRPGAQLPTEANRSAGARYQELVQNLEREGEVLCLEHGGFTKTSHFQLLGLLDIMKTEKRLPPDFEAALQSHRYAAILTDAEPGNDDLSRTMRQAYPHVECLNLPDTWIVTGFLTPTPTRRVWLLRP